ncbi:MAG: GNAT family N-acetyltransferase [Bacillota bacterium]|nr:GNAT family N-acetyltransferase [Bacillota bacterium]
MDTLIKNISIPPQLKGICALRAVSETGRTAAVAIFAASPIHKEEMHLIHLQVLPECRGQGLTQQLLRYAEHYFYGQGVRSIRVKCCGSQEKLEPLYDFLMEEGFLPHFLLGRLLQYRLTDWLQSPFFGKTAFMRDRTPSVVTISDWNDIRLQKFLREHPDFSLPEETYDGKHCHFYLERNQIQAVLCAEQISENLLFLYDLYFAEGCQNQTALITLLAAFTQHAQRVLPADARLVLQNRIASLTRGLMDQFGLPEAKYIVQEYVYILSGEVQEPPADGYFFGRFTPAVSAAGAEAASLLCADLEPASLQCMQSAAALLPNTFLHTRSNASTWQEEMNTWLKQLGREPLPAQQAIPTQLFNAQQAQPKNLPPSIIADMVLPGAISQKNALHYFIFSDEPEAFAGLLPKYLRSRFLRGELIVIGGRNQKNEVLSYAVFSEQNTPKKTFLMEYIYVSPDHRNHNYGRELLRFAAKAFSQIGSKGISAKQAGTAEQVAGIHTFLKKAGFHPVAMSARILAYSLSELHRSEFLRLTESMKGNLPKVEHISDRSNFHLRRFAAEAMKHNVPFDLLHFNTMYSRFFFRQGDIRSAIFTEQASPKLLTITDSWFENNAAQVRIALLEAILNEASHRMQEDATMVLRLDRSWNIQALQSLLGSGTAELRLFEYIMPF